MSNQVSHQNLLVFPLHSVPHMPPYFNQPRKQNVKPLLATLIHATTPTHLIQKNIVFLILLSKFLSIYFRICIPDRICQYKLEKCAIFFVPLVSSKTCLVIGLDKMRMTELEVEKFSRPLKDIDHRIGYGRLFKKKWEWFPQLGESGCLYCKGSFSDSRESRAPASLGICPYDPILIFRVSLHLIPSVP